MRVALCAPYRKTQVSGVSVFVENLGSRLVERGHHVDCITPDVFHRVESLPRGLRNGALALATFWRIICSSPLWTAIHANQPHLQSVAALLAARCAKIRFVVTYHSEMPIAAKTLARFAQTIAHRLLEDWSDEVVFVSDATRRQFGRQTDAVIHMGLDFQAPSGTLVKKFPKSGNQFSFLYVGRQTRSKGFFDFLDAAHRLTEERELPSFRITICGEVAAQEQNEKEHWISLLGPVVRDLGLVTRQTVLKVLEDGDAIVLPSYSEGIPFVIIEAMYARCVPIVSDAGGLPELVLGGHSGLVVSPGDIDGLCSAMAWSLTHTEDLARLATNAYETVSARFRFDQTVVSYEELYARGNPRVTPATPHS